MQIEIGGIEEGDGGVDSEGSLFRLKMDLGREASQAIQYLLHGALHPRNGSIESRAAFAAAAVGPIASLARAIADACGEAWPYTTVSPFSSTCDTRFVIANPSC